MRSGGGKAVLQGQAALAGPGSGGGGYGGAPWAKATKNVKKTQNQMCELKLRFLHNKKK